MIDKATRWCRPTHPTFGHWASNLSLLRLATTRSTPSALGAGFVDIPDAPSWRSPLRRMLFMASFISLLKLFSLAVSSPLISLSSGVFRGLTINGTDRWLGIPYAQPPVGALRFKAPLPISRPAEGVQDAFQFSYACPQPPTTAPVSEDCLHLNVCHAILDHIICAHLGSAICRCGDHNRLRLLQSFLSLFGYMYERFKQEHLRSANLLVGWCI